MFVYVIRMYLYIGVILSCQLVSDWLAQNVRNSGIFNLLSCVMCLWNGKRISFSKQYRYIANYLHLYATNYYISFCTANLFQLLLCALIVSDNIFWNAAFTAVVIFYQIRFMSLVFEFCSHLNKLWLNLLHKYYTKQGQIIYLHGSHGNVWTFHLTFKVTVSHIYEGLFAHMVIYCCISDIAYLW